MFAPKITSKYVEIIFDCPCGKQDVCINTAECTWTCECGCKYTIEKLNLRMDLPSCGMGDGPDVPIPTGT